MSRQEESRGEKARSDGIERRLDALIRMTIEILTNENHKMETGEVIRALRSAGLTPSEIGKIMGKERTYVSGFIYGSKAKRKV